MPWGSMGNHSKILGIPGFRGLWQVEDTLVWNKTGSASSQGGSLTKHCGKKMFFLCSDGGRHCARFGRENARRPISRVLSRPLAGPWMTIPLGRPLPDASRDLPGRRRRKRAWPAPVPCGIGRPAAPMRSCSRWGLPCRRRYRRRGALLPHPFTLTGNAAPAGHGNRRFAFCGTFPGVAPAGYYPAPCFRGARTFLDPAVTGEAAVIQPSGEGRGRDAGRRSQPEARSRISSSPSLPRGSTSFLSVLCPEI
jgi:hypothetical protein